MSELRDLISNEIKITKDLSIQKILNNLLDGSKDLDLKTHINKPKQLSALIILADYLELKKLPNSAKLIKDFIADFLRKMVSYKRLSRTEIIKAFQSINESERLERAKTNPNIDV